MSRYRGSVAVTRRISACTELCLQTIHSQTLSPSFPSSLSSFLGLYETIEGIDHIIGSSSATCHHQHLLVKATTPALLMSRLMGTQRMSPGNPQDGHSLRDTSNSSSASSIKMPELVTSSSDDNGSFRNNTKNSPNFSSRSHGRHSSISRENLLDDTTSSEEGNDEDTRTKLFSLIMKKYATRQSHEKQRAAHTVPQASLTKCHRLCAHMHAPRRAGGPWIQCKNQCRDKDDHNGRHSCYRDCHNQPSTFRVQVRVM